MNTSPSSETAFPAARLFYVVGSIMLIIGALRVGQSVFLPITLALLLSFVLSPGVRWLESFRLGRTASVLITCSLACGGLGLAAWALTSQIQVLAEDLPNHKTEIRKKLESFRPSGDSTMGRLSEMLDDLAPAEPPPAGPDDSAQKANPRGDVIFVREPDTKSSPIATLSRVVAPALEPLVVGTMVFVLVIFLLLRREDMRFRMISLMGDAAITGTTRLMGDAAQRVSRYLLTLFLVNAAFGVWFGVGLQLLGVPYAPLWGFLTLCFRFIPFVGSPASVLFPMLMSIATSSGWSEPMWVLAFFSISELVTANVIEPILFGRTTGLTPIALLIAALFWTWVWGPLGLLLSTPLTVFLVVMGQHVPHLRSLKVLLAEQPVLDARLQFFQRLIARDSKEAHNLVTAYAHENGLESAFDDVLVPVLRLARKEREKENIAASEAAFVWAMSEAAIERMGTACAPFEEDAPEHGPLSVYGHPVHHEVDEIALLMFRDLMKQRGEVTLGSIRQLPSRAIDAIVEKKPDILVLMVVPPGGLPQVKFMCSEVRKRCPDLPIIVTYLGKFADYDESLVHLRNAGASYVTTSLAQTRVQIGMISNDRGSRLTTVS